jgi:hypothetical protein
MIIYDYKRTPLFLIAAVLGRICEWLCFGTMGASGGETVSRAEARVNAAVKVKPALKIADKGLKLSVLW